MRKFCIVLWVAMVLAAACSSSDTTSTATTAGSSTGGASTAAPTSNGDEPSGTTSAVAVEPYRGVTDDTIKIGVAINDVKQFAPVGDIWPRFEAVINATNDQGGINGRMIEVVYKEWGIADRAASDAACVTFTEDEEVFLMLGFLPGGWNDMTCYSRNDTIFINSTTIATEDLAITDGLLFTAETATINNLQQGLPALADEFADSVVVVTGGADQESAVDEFVAVVESLRPAKVVKHLQQVGGSDDLVEAEAELDVALESWGAENVEWVVGVTAGQIGGVLAAMSRAGTLDLNIVNPEASVGAIEALGANLTEFPNLFAVGPPPREATYLAGLHGTPECVDGLAETLGITIAPYPPDDQEDPLPTAIGVCAVWDAFTAVATEAGANLTTETFLAAGESLGTFPMTGAPSGSLVRGNSYMPNSEAVLFRYDGQEFVLVE